MRLVQVREKDWDRRRRDALRRAHCRARRALGARVLLNGDADDARRARLRRRALDRAALARGDVAPARPAGGGVVPHARRRDARVARSMSISS